MAPTGSLSPEPQSRTMSAYALEDRRNAKRDAKRDTKRDRRRRQRQVARDEAEATGSYEPQYHKRKGHTASQNEEERWKGQERRPSVDMQQGAKNTEGLNQVSEKFDPTLDFLKGLIEGTIVNPLHQQQPVTNLGQSSSALRSDAASQKSPVSLTKLHPPLPARSAVAKPPPRTLSTAKASPLPAKPRSIPDNESIRRLTRNLWDTRREMTALQARETDLIASLRGLHAPQHILETGQATSELEERLAQVENELEQESYKRLQAERGLNEIERESRAPFVIPALFRAFLNISEMVV